MKESDPIAVLSLASKAIAALGDTAASAGEKAAAPRTAAFAVEQAAAAQAMAQVIASAIDKASKA